MNRPRSLSIAIGFLTFIAIGCAAKVSQTEPAVTPKAIASASPVTPSAAPKTAQTPESSGSPFVVVPNSGHTQISGTAKTILEGEKRHLVFDKTFNIESGPDLTVVLVRSPELTSPQLEEGSYLLLDELQSNSGEQRYEIPGNVNLEDFGSIAIWCRQFNTTFGYASLSKN